MPAGEKLEKIMRCVLDGYLECAAKTPEACICIKMPRDMYLEKLKNINGTPLA